MITIRFVRTARERGEAYAVRVAVFQKEQGIDLELDFDGHDEDAKHVIAYDGRKPVGTARVLCFPKRGTIKIGRVAVLASYRNRKIGTKIMQCVLERFEGRGIREVRLNSQEYVKQFYEKLGFRQNGEPFEEAGIVHVAMTKSI